MKTLIALAATVSALAMAAPASATTYVLNQNVGTGTAVGTITTDNTLGVLGSSNITAFNITINDGTSSFTLTDTNAARQIGGTAFTATATGLFFNFGAAAGSYALFQNPTIGSGIDYFCLQTSGCYSPAVAGMGLRVQGNILTSSLQGNVQFASVANSAVPEPATWVMMLAGFGALGFAMRRRTNVAARIRFA